MITIPAALLCAVFVTLAAVHVGFFKRVRDTAFARYDTFVYSPLCAVIAALAVWLSVGR